MIKAVFDTNVIIDYLSDRAPFADTAEKLFDICERGDVRGVLTASAATDIYYIMRKLAGREKAIEGLKLLLSVFEVADVGKSDLLRAMELSMSDFEDALVAVCAKRVKAECIITRDKDDFSKSPILAISPEDFLSHFFPKYHL